MIQARVYQSMFFGMISLVALGCSEGGHDTGSSTSEVGSTESSSGSESGSESGSQTGTDTDEIPECQYPGEICGDQSLCQCHFVGSETNCQCEPTTCTEDSHCADDEICWFFTNDDDVLDDDTVYSRCIPAVCGGEPPDITLVGPNADPSPYADVACARRFVLDGTALTDLSVFSNLQYVLESVVLDNNPNLVDLDGFAVREAQQVEIDYNSSLTDISALTSLETLLGGRIACNPMLPTAHIESVLAQVPNGDQVDVVNNGEGPC